MLATRRKERKAGDYSVSVDRSGEQIYLPSIPQHYNPTYLEEAHVAF